MTKKHCVNHHNLKYNIIDSENVVKTALELVGNMPLDTDILIEENVKDPKGHLFTNRYYITPSLVRAAIQKCFW